MATVESRYATTSVRELLRVDLPPAYRLRRRSAGKSSRIRPRIGDLEEEVVPLFLDLEHFLNLRLGLQHEVLRRTSTKDQQPAQSSLPLCVENDRCRLIDIKERSIRVA